MTTRELLQRLLEAMEDPDISYEGCLDLRIDIRAHLANPEPEFDTPEWWAMVAQHDKQKHGVE